IRQRAGILALREVPFEMRGLLALRPAGIRGHDCNNSVATCTSDDGCSFYFQMDARSPCGDAACNNKSKDWCTLHPKSTRLSVAREIHRDAKLMPSAAVRLTLLRIFQVRFSEAVR